MTDAVIADKSLRSVFVGNIPYEVTEEKLKEIFTNVGPVVSFKLVFDRDSGKPKGYGFCEFKDQETAMCAMRNLNNYEIGGRTLRVDNACTEKSRLEMQSLMQNSSQDANQYGDYVNPEKAPEAISKVIASLPPEQTYNFIKQMKQCIQNNPDESRQLLLRNPQLSYALLQSLIVMRIMEPQVALSMLHPFNSTPAVLNLESSSNNSITLDLEPGRLTTPTVATSTSDTHHLNHHWNNVTSSQAVTSSQPVALSQNLPHTLQSPPNMQPVHSLQPAPSMQAPPPPPPLIAQDMDMRTDLRGGNRFGDQDLRIPPASMVTQMRDSMYDPYGRPPVENSMEPPRYPGPPPPPPMMAGSPHMSMNMHPMAGMSPVPPNMNNVSRMSTPSGSVQRPPLPSTPSASSLSVPSVTSMPIQPPTSGANTTPTIAGAGPDTEKAVLIMQVLQLTDEQVALLPAEQQQSIFVLKDQIAKSAKRS